MIYKLTTIQGVKGRKKGVNCVIAEILSNIIKCVDDQFMSINKKEVIHHKVDHFF